MVITFDPTGDQALFWGKIKQSSAMLPMKIPYSLLQMGWKYFQLERSMNSRRAKHPRKCPPQPEGRTISVSTTASASLEYCMIVKAADLYHDRSSTDANVCSSGLRKEQPVISR